MLHVVGVENVAQTEKRCTAAPADFILTVKAKRPVSYPAPALGQKLGALQ